MKKRIGNDIQFTWHIYRKSGETQVPESFTGKDVEVKLISPLKQPVTIEDVSIATGVVTFTFRGKHQVTLGNYVAVLQENRGEDGMVTLDVVDAVTLVPHSYMEEDGDDGDVIEAEAVELESSISAGSGIEQQQADWAQTDDTAVDYIKNKPNLDLFARLDVSNEHEQNTFDTYKHLYGGEQELRRTSIGGGGLLLRVGRLQPVWFEYEDVEKLKDLPTATELTEELEGKYDKVRGVTIADRQVLAASENGLERTSFSPNEVQFKEQNGTQSAEIWLNGGYLRLNDKYHTSQAGNKIATDLELAAKQDTINDLAAIRNGATLGATAYQKPQTGIPATDLASDVQSDLAAIDGIEAVIPEQASESNQLADKDFVNSAIATATATYRGSYNIVSDLLLSVSATQQQIATALATKMAALSITPDNNDYCFVQIPTADATPTEIARIDRYKYDGTAWAYEYSLNNSSFTAAQWAALNSGITSGLVAKLSALPTNSELITLLAGKANTADLAPVATSGSYNDLKDKPDLSAFITKSVDDLTNYYLKSETYTKNEVLQLIGAIQQFHYEVYPTLPQTGANNVLYLIGPTGTGTDKYEEYVYANNDWTKIGDTSIDLSGYVTTQALATALATALADYVTSSALSTTLANYYNKTEVDDVPTANSKNLVTSGCVYDALQGEYVVATAAADIGSVATAMVGIYDVNDVLIVEGEGEVTARILYGKTYKVKCSRVYDYLTPAEQTFTASILSRQVAMQYTYIERDVVTLDQTISDSAQMLSGDIQGDVIKEIRSHSHLYLGTPATQSGDTEGTELLCQLSDEDSRLYYDGTPAALDGSEGDQWLKLPVFWWKIVGVGEAAADGAHDQYRFMFAFAGEPDPSWNKWQGDRNLVGAKEMKVVDGKGRSVSGGQSTGSFTQAQGNAYAEARNLGCQEVTWEWQWMMCMLCYAWNGDTNSQKTNGIGANSYARTLGVTDQLGMTDTTPAQATSLTSARFWGLEAWWNCKNEWLGNVVMEDYVLSITDQNTKQIRQVSDFIRCGGTGGWNSRMRIDANGDFVPLAKAGTETTFYCDWVNSNSGSRVLYRSNYNALALGGVAYVSAGSAPSYTDAYYGSRLAFNGVITEAGSVAAYKAALA